jgi:L-asparaginase
MNSSNVTNEKSVLILYTGGTMGMQKIEDGSLAPVKGYLTEQISLLPHHPEMPQIIVKEYEEVLDSSSMGPREWAIIVNDIETNYLKYDGFVIIIGTDTMAYASSAVSFMLENIGKPVIFTGSTIPFSEVYSDARRNLLVSIIFASGTTFNEVCICFNDRLLRANRSCKVNSIGLTAFDSPNFPPLATMGAFIKENTELALAPPRGLFRTYKTIDSRVMVWRLLPGFDDSPLVAILGNGSDMRGVVLEMFGTGNGPPSARLLAAIKDAVTRGIVIVAVSQCLVGGVDLSMVRHIN